MMFSMHRILITKRVLEKNYANLRGNETHPTVHVVSTNIFEEVLQKSSSTFEMFDIFEIFGYTLYNSNDNLNLIQHIMKEMENGPSLFVVSKHIHNLITKLWVNSD